MMRTLLLFFFSFLLIQSTFAEEAGVGIESTIGTGYGLYAVTMRASNAPGAISSFYLYEQNGAYPARWHEIDLEFNPGFTGIGQIADPNHIHASATGQCYSSDGTNHDNLPDPATCSVQLFLTGKAGAAISFNAYAHRAIDDQPYSYSNDQVFMAPTNGNHIFTHYYTYYFYYTPKGIYWTKDLPATKLTLTPPASLPQPVFVKKDFNLVKQNPNWNFTNNPAYLGFTYDSLPLTPQKTDGTLTQTGALMRLSLNLWDGTNTDPTHQQDWGGEVSPAPGSSSSYQYIAYYPLLTPVATVGNDPTALRYGPAEIYNDFTTPTGLFLINQEETTFTDLWRISNGNYSWPLGQLDERNLYCGQGSLTLTISDPYPTPRNNSLSDTNCPWLNQH